MPAHPHVQIPGRGEESHAPANGPAQDRDGDAVWADRDRVWLAALSDWPMGIPVGAVSADPLITRTQVVASRRRYRA